MKAFIALFLLLSHTYSFAHEGIYANEGHDLTRDEVIQYRKAADGGNAAAAQRLSEYYLLAVDDIPEGLFWLRFAAELGDCGAVTDIATMIRGRRVVGDLDFFQARSVELRCAPVAADQN